MSWLKSKTVCHTRSLQTQEASSLLRFSTGQAVAVISFLPVYSSGIHDTRTGFISSSSRFYSGEEEKQFRTLGFFHNYVVCAQCIFIFIGRPSKSCLVRCDMKIFISPKSVAQARKEKNEKKWEREDNTMWVKQTQLQLYENTYVSREITRISS